MTRVPARACGTGQDVRRRQVHPRLRLEARIFRVREDRPFGELDPASTASNCCQSGFGVESDRDRRMARMKSALSAVAIVATLTLVGSALAGGPVTKQNGSKPVIEKFTSICAVAGYAGYGLCGGSTNTFSGVGGKMNAVQPKSGTYNLDFSFSGLTPGTEYRLWSTRDAHVWVEVGRRSRTRPARWRTRCRPTLPRPGLRPEHHHGRHHDRDVLVVGPEAGRQRGQLALLDSRLSRAALRRVAARRAPARARPCRPRGLEARPRVPA